jgi:hypothetical protein
MSSKICALPNAVLEAGFCAYTGQQASMCLVPSDNQKPCIGAGNKFLDNSLWFHQKVVFLMHLLFFTCVTAHNWATYAPNCLTQFHIHLYMSNISPWISKALQFCLSVPTCLNYQPHHNAAIKQTTIISNHGIGDYPSLQWSALCTNVCTLYVHCGVTSSPYDNHVEESFHVTLDLDFCLVV